MNSNPRKHAEEQAKERIRARQSASSVDSVLDGILNHDRAALAQGITWVESTRESDQQRAAELLKKCLPHAGHSLRIGITGVPGVGKSTFIDAFGEFVITNGHRVAVLAIDPSSAISGGSILGDKTRMNALSMNPHAFIRPSPSSNTLGGVARKTRESLLLCEAAGYDVILVETVGVGQSETAVHGMTDLFLLLMLAGAGDQLQGIKRGIMEMADIMLITKADGQNAAQAKRASGEYASALHLFPPRTNGWNPPVLTCSALEKRGVEEAWSSIQQFEQWMKSRGFFEAHRMEQDETWMMEALREEILQLFFKDESRKERMNQARKAVEEKRMTPFEAAEWIARVDH